jgi:hypothetical protein
VTVVNESDSSVYNLTIFNFDEAELLELPKGGAKTFELSWNDASPISSGIQIQYILFLDEKRHYFTEENRLSGRGTGRALQDGECGTITIKNNGWYKQ